jgi:RNA polymerase sigma factor (sigma-70 family)
MADIPENHCEDAELRRQSAGMTAPGPRAWFVREVLPLETMLMKLLRRNWSNADDIDDIRQDVYVRVFEAACKKIPEAAQPFVLTTARNLLIDRVRREHIVPIEAVADLEELSVASNDAEPERTVIARDALRLLLAAIDKLPPRPREAVLLNKIEGLSRREIAARMGIAEDTVRQHLIHGMRCLADFLYSEQLESRRHA